MSPPTGGHEELRDGQASPPGKEQFKRLVGLSLVSLIVCVLVGGVVYVVTGDVSVFIAIGVVWLLITAGLALANRQQSRTHVRIFITVVAVVLGVGWLTFLAFMWSR